MVYQNDKGVQTVYQRCTKYGVPNFSKVYQRCTNLVECTKGVPKGGMEC